MSIFDTDATEAFSADFGGLRLAEGSFRGEEPHAKRSKVPLAALARWPSRLLDAQYQGGAQLICGDAFENSPLRTRLDLTVPPSIQI